jgi:hypothetical protein
VHAACAEIRISRGHRFGYFPKPTAVDPKQSPAAGNCDGEKCPIAARC